MTTIALDYDGCYTTNPNQWGVLASMCRASGDEVITVTSRQKTSENKLAMRAAGITWPIVFAGHKPKKLAAIEAGYSIQIWIDDNPQGIGDGTENVATQSVYEIELRHVLKVLESCLDQQYYPFMREALRSSVERIKTVVGE